jgi:hypothetical protein
MNDAANGHPRDKLSEYLDDALEIEARELVDRHLAECEDCRAELDALWHLASAVGAETVPPVPGELAARIGRRLDQATVARPRFRRFVFPASIAATIGAMGLLVVLQWREGRFSPTPVSQRADEARENNELKSMDELSTSTPAEDRNAAQPVPAPAKEKAPAGSLYKDQKRDEEPVLQEERRQKKTEAAPSDGGVVGGVVGGVAGGVEGGVGDGSAEGVAGGVGGGVAHRERGASERDAKQRVAVEDARADAPSSRVENLAAAAKPKASAPFAPVPAPASAPPSAKASLDGGAPCIDRWSDSAARGDWGVPDIFAAERQLGRVAHAVGGIGLWRGVQDGRPYVVVVPRDHFEEVFYALKARGVAGLNEAPTLPEGTDCVGISVALTLVPEPQASPAPGH